MEVKKDKKPSLYLQARWKDKKGETKSKAMTVYDITAEALFKMIDGLAKQHESDDLKQRLELSLQQAAERVQGKL